MRMVRSNSDHTFKIKGENLKGDASTFVGASEMNGLRSTHAATRVWRDQVNMMFENVRGSGDQSRKWQMVPGVNGANGGGGGVPDFATIIAQQLQNLLPTIVAQVGNHVNNQGNNKNQDDNVTNDNNQGNVRTMNNGQGGCSYKEFMACNLKDYDGKGGAGLHSLD
ncbi:hypothetical protein Tco_0771064 [Tanacetum coccineum]|uniref:Uncharacterized protein n=1 Tax=Tanacetum coccineum TaxID=301880 RepID=A0ABQ4ZHR1_9ASTR